MKTVKKEVKVFIERLLCDCGKEMSTTGRVFGAYPPMYEYSCDCGKSCVDYHVYPKTVYES